VPIKNGEKLSSLGLECLLRCKPLLELNDLNLALGSQGLSSAELADDGVGGLRGHQNRSVICASPRRTGLGGSSRSTWLAAEELLMQARGNARRSPDLSDLRAEALALASEALLLALKTL